MSSGEAKEGYELTVFQCNMNEYNTWGWDQVSTFLFGGMEKKNSNK